MERSACAKMVSAPVPTSSRMAPSTASAAVKPSPMPRPSAVEATRPFLEAKASARPRMMQLTTMRGMNTPRLSDSAGV